MRWNEEHVLTAQGLDGIALRSSLLYGPAPASDALIDGLRKRKLPVVRNSGRCRKVSRYPRSGAGSRVEMVMYLSWTGHAPVMYPSYTCAGDAPDREAVMPASGCCERGAAVRPAVAFRPGRWRAGQGSSLWAMTLMTGRSACPQQHSSRPPCGPCSGRASYLGRW
jgi:hypothetical protein